MSRWFRMYDEVLDDPKVQRLSGDDFKAWVNLLCLASRNDGKLPCAEDIAFALRIDAKKGAAVIGRLVSAGLLLAEDDCFSPNKWNDRQYKSDVSTSRVKRFRERSKTVSETAPDTETDTEKNTVDKSTAVDPEKVMFDSGVNLLTNAGKSRDSARTLLGKWKRDHGAAAVIEALGAAQREGAINPVSFIEGRWRQRHREVEDVPLC
jgi:hypothetical protein